MTRSEHYYAGKAEGEAYGEEDLASALGVTHHQESSLRAMGARDVHGTNIRAWYLGAARGYRQVVRTLRDGRWGT